MAMPYMPCGKNMAMSSTLIYIYIYRYLVYKERISSKLQYANLHFTLNAFVMSCILYHFYRSSYVCYPNINLRGG